MRQKRQFTTPIKSRLSRRPAGFETHFLRLSTTITNSSILPTNTLNLTHIPALQPVYTPGFTAPVTITIEFPLSFRNYITTTRSPATMSARKSKSSAARHTRLRDSLQGGNADTHTYTDASQRARIQLSSS